MSTGLFTTQGQCDVQEHRTAWVDIDLPGCDARRFLSLSFGTQWQAKNMHWNIISVADTHTAKPLTNLLVLALRFICHVVIVVSQKVLKSCNARSKLFTFILHVIFTKLSKLWQVTMDISICPSNLTFKFYNVGPLPRQFTWQITDMNKCVSCRHKILWFSSNTELHCPAFKRIIALGCF